MNNFFNRDSEAQALYCDVYVTCAHIDDFFSVRAVLRSSKDNKDFRIRLKREFTHWYMCNCQGTELRRTRIIIKQCERIEETPKPGSQHLVIMLRQRGVGCPLPHVQSGGHIEMNSNTQLRTPRAELPDWAVGIHARITSSSHLMWQNRNTLVVTKSP